MLLVIMKLFFMSYHTALPDKKFPTNITGHLVFSVQFHVAFQYFLGRQLLSADLTLKARFEWGGWN